MDKLKQIPGQILGFWKKFSKKQKIIIISSTVTIMVALAILAVVIKTPNMQVLTICKSYSEMSQVTKLLSDNSFKYETEDSTMAVKVDQKDLTKAKMVLASSGIQTSGYTIDDALKSDFSTTEADKQKQWQTYLESKFAADLSSMEGIKSASVTVVLGDSTNTYYASKANASVSAVLDLGGKTMDSDTAASVAQFLATSVGNSNTDNITVISTTGETLFAGGSENSGTGNGNVVGYNTQQKYKAQIESTIKSSLKQSLLSTHLFDDAQIALNLSLNFDSVNEIATKYSAQEGRDEGLFSKSSVEKSVNGGGNAAGVPGTTANANDTTYQVTNGVDGTSSYTVENYEYLPDVLVTTTNRQPGTVILNNSSITVTLVKNAIYNEDDAEAAGYLNGATWDEFKANNSQPTPINVDNNWLTAISTGTGIAAQNITVLAYQVPYFVDSQAKSNAKTIAFWVQIALAAIIIGILAFVIIRSARPLTVEEKEPELSVEEMLATTKENLPPVDDIDLQEKSETRKAIEKFVDENPEAVALLLRNWLNDGWE